MANTPSRITDPQNIEAPQRKLQLDTIGYVKLVGATPSVLAQSHLLSHGAATTVTEFKNGKDGQDLYILGNGNTTVSHNTKIKTSTGANKVLAANKMYHFKHYNGVFYEVTT